MDNDARTISARIPFRERYGQTPTEKNGLRLL